MTETLEQLAAEAVAGKRDAVERLVRALAPDVYGMALRMLWHPEDAEDASQEILVRVVTHLSQFAGQSRLRTWVYRIATNYLLDVKKSATERMRLSFESFGEDLRHGLSDDGPAENERSVLVEEVRLGCTLAMLQCLDRPHRLAYVLGEILELPATDGAEALGIAPAAFRKRLERARERVETFTRAHCGLIADDAACRCHRRVVAAEQLGRIEPGRLRFADSAASFVEARRLVRGADAARRAIELHRLRQPGAPSAELVRRIVAALDGGTSS
jgi:RNA polymerase sigma factor (sigma-70 family)